MRAMDGLDALAVAVGSLDFVDSLSVGRAARTSHRLGMDGHGRDTDTLDILFGFCCCFRKRHFDGMMLTTFILSNIFAE